MFTNRRQAFRCAVAEPDAQALLRLCAGEVVVQVVNESANGFGVESERELVVHEGELAGLTTKAGQSICRVVRVEIDDQGHTSVGLQRISEIADEPQAGGNTGLFVRWFGQGVGSVLLLVAFGLGLGCVMGLAKFSTFFVGAPAKTIEGHNLIPSEPGKRTAALGKSFDKLSSLSSLQFVKALKLSSGQQGKIDTIVDKLMYELASVHVDRTSKSPESSAHMGLMMIRHAWVQVEDLLTPDQMQQWDSMLEDKAAPAGADQAKS